MSLIGLLWFLAFLVGVDGFYLSYLTRMLSVVSLSKIYSTHSLLTPFLEVFLKELFLFK